MREILEGILSARKMSIRRLAKHCGVSPETIRKIILIQGYKPSLSTVDKIAKRLGLSREALLKKTDF